jgi:hypothetical protein
MTKKLNLSISIAIFFLMYISLLFGFFFNENSSGGSEKDFYFTFFITESISINLIDGIKLLINSNIPHSPLHYIILGTAHKYISNIESLRFIILQFNILVPFFFYKCLIEILVKKEQALLLSSIIFLSPYFRSSAIWATTDNTALLFFLISLFFFLKAKKNLYNSGYNYVALSILFLGLSALTRFYYITFIIYIIFELIKRSHIKYFIINGILIFIIFSPSVAYFFAIKKLLYNYTTNNIFNNIYINISIIFFYLIPFIFFSLEKFNDFINFLKNNKNKLLIIITLFSLLFYNFNYYEQRFGGGILYQVIKIYLSYYSLLFYILSIIGVITIFFVIDKNINNILLILIIFFSFNYMIIYQKYFDPLLLICFFILFSNITDKFFNKNFLKNFIFTFIYFLVFLIISVTKNI